VKDLLKNIANLKEVKVCSEGFESIISIRSKVPIQSGAPAIVNIKYSNSPMGGETYQIIE